MIKTWIALMVLITVATPSRVESALVSYWNFNDGKTAADAVGGNNGVEFKNFQAAPTHSTNAPPGGGAFSLDLSHGKDYVTLPPVTFGITNEYTISAWVNATTFGRSIISVKRDLTSGGADRSGLGFGVQNGFAYTGLISSTTNNAANTGATFHDILTATSVPTGQWVHLAATLKNDKITMYINGVAETRYTGAGAADGTLKVRNQDIDFIDPVGSFSGLGADGSAPAAADSAGDFTTAFFDGLLDEVAIWNVALDSQDVQYLAQGGSPPFALALSIRNIEPRNNANFVSASSQIRFTAESSFGLDPQGIQLILNGADRTADLVITGNDPMAAREVSFSKLLANQEYRAEISVTDRKGNKRSQAVSFDTYSDGIVFIEAEDYNFDGGQFLNAPEISGAPGPNNYLDRLGVKGVDHHILRSTNANPYRIGDPAGTGFANDVPLRKQFADAQAADPRVEDYSLNALLNGEWFNYTRTFPAKPYRVFARVATTSAFDVPVERVTGVGAAQQVFALGAFRGTGTGGANNYVLAPLTDVTGKPVTLNLAGDQSLRLAVRSGGSGLKVNYLLFVPAPAGSAPYISAIQPAPGEIDVKTNAPVRVVIPNQSTRVKPESLRLQINGQDVTGTAVTTPTADGVTVAYQPAGGWPQESTQTVVLNFGDDATPANVFSNQWQFTVMHVPSGNTPEVFADTVFRVTFDGNNPNDITTGNVSTAVMANNVTYTRDLPAMANSSGTAAVFNGTDAWLSYGLGAGDELKIQSTFTYHARVKFTAAGLAQNREEWVMGRFRTTPQQANTRVSFMTLIPSAGTPRMSGGVSGDGGAWVGPSSAAVLPDVFYDVFQRFTPRLIRQDVFNAETGSRLGQALSAATTFTNLMVADSTFDVGNRTTPNNVPLDGLIEQINVWNRALSDDEIRGIAYGPVTVVPRLEIRQAKVTQPGTLQLIFQTNQSNRQYAVQQASSLSNPVWSEVPAVNFTTAANGEITAQFAAPPASPSFYRMLLK